MTTATVEERLRRIYCPTHKISFEVLESKRILCESGGHALAEDFPCENFWEYCCDCRNFWPSEMDKGGKAKDQCLVCARDTARRYVCDHCKLVSLESDDPARRKQHRINARGAVEPSCPGCSSAAKSPLQEHVCEDVAAKFVTARSSCPFCEEPIKAKRGREEANPTCQHCGTFGKSTDRFCKSCGKPMAESSQPPAAPRESGFISTASFAPTYTPASPSAVVSTSDPSAPTLRIPTQWTSEPQPQGFAPVDGDAVAVGPNEKRGSGKAFLVIAALIILAAIIAGSALVGGNKESAGSPGWGRSESFESKLDRALNSNDLFSSSGDSASSLFAAEYARSPNSDVVKSAAKKIQGKLEPIGNDNFQRYYAESDETIDWGYLANVYRLLMQTAPDNSEYSARYHYSLGIGRLKAKNFSDAVSSFEEALRYRPDWAMAYNGLGRAYVQEDWSARDESKTVRYYEKACDLDPGFTWGCRNLGAYYMKVNNWYLAEQYVSKALERSPGRESIWKMMAKICPKVGKYQDPSTGYCY